VNDKSDFDQLDTLLRQPATLADRGFSERVKLSIGRSNTARRNLFLITGFCWLVLMLIASSPQAIYANLTIMASSLDLSGIGSYVEYLYQFLRNPTQDLSYPTIALTLLSIAAVVSTSIRA
jgi:hypothetical protein